MKITNIAESTHSNVLNWAIKNGADIKSEQQLQTIINDELFYIVTITNVNFFELFRLTQTFRDKLRIINEKVAEIPSNKELMNYFVGNFSHEDDPEKKSPLYEIASYAATSFFNLSLQMKTDDDIISKSSVALFLPMITRKFDVKIPISFYDFISSMTDDEAKECFTTEYPSTLQPIIDKENIEGVYGMITRLFFKLTTIIKYNNKFETYLKCTKYFPMKKIDNSKLYKVAIISFYKYNRITKSDDRVSLFLPDKNEYNKYMKKLACNNSPLQVEFAVQLPIAYMQIIENYFSSDELMIAYESSMSTIIDDGIRFNDFIEPVIDIDPEDSSETLEKFENQLSIYNTRIAEANNTTLSAINMLLKSDGEIDKSVTFSLLPSIYNTRAIFRFSIDKISSVMDKLNNPVIHDIFADMLDVANSINNEINNMK